MNLTGLLTGIGQAGSDIAQANLDAQQAKLKDLFDKLGLKQGEVNLAESQERLKQLQLQPKTPQEEAEGKLKALKSIFPDMSDEDARYVFGLLPSSKTMQGVTEQIETGLKALPDEQRKMVEPEVKGYLVANQPEKALQVLSSFAEKFQAEPGTPGVLSPTGGGAPYGIKMGKKMLVPSSPGWTPQNQAVLDAAVASYQKAQKEKREEQEKLAARRLALAKTTMTTHENEKLFGDFDKAKKTMKAWEHLSDVGEDAKGYVDNPSGPGDVALMLGYIESIRPTSGFRFTTTEQKLILENTRDVVAAMQAKWEQGYRGLLFGPAGSDQRRDIGKIVADAKAQVDQYKDEYLSGIQQINPKLYDILTDNNDDLEPVQ